MYEAEKHALEEYILGSFENRNDSALKIALLTRDVIPAVTSKIVRKFAQNISDLLVRKYSLPPAIEMPPDIIGDYGVVSWRGDGWSRGWNIRVEYRSSNWMWGFQAPSSQAGAPSGKYDFLDGKLRSEIENAIRAISFRSRISLGHPWWPAVFTITDLPKWNSVDCLLKAAGFAQHEGMSLVDWLADDLDLLYRTVDKVLSEHAQSQP
jgi:hypothetical protein